MPDSHTAPAGAAASARPSRLRREPFGTLRDGHPAGVFSWPVPPALVVALSSLLDGRPT